MREYVRRYRAMTKMSQSDLAKKLEVSQQLVSAFETGKKNKHMSLLFAQRLADAFGVNFNDIVENEKTYLELK